MHSLGLFLLMAGPLIAREADSQERDTKNEIAVLGGVSILNASGSSERMFGSGSFPGFPGGLPGITVRSESSLGSSPLFGARYSRYIKDRVAVEADFAMAPSHELELGGEVCLEGFGCFGEGDLRAGGFDGRFLKRDVTAWHYGGGLAYDLTEGDVRPLLLVGAGGVTWDGASDTDFVFRFGAGLKLLFGRMGVRVDVVDHLVLDHFLTRDNEHDVHATAGFLVGF